MLNRKVAMCVLAGSIAVASRAGAEPLLITGGFMSQPAIVDTFNPFLFVGDGFSLAGAMDAGGGVDVATSCGTLCAGGDPINLNALFVGTSPNGEGQFGGASYSSLALSGELSFTTALATAPAVEGPFTITQPFSMVGMLTGYIEYNLPTEQSVFSTTLFGAGFLTAQFISHPPNPGQAPLFELTSIRWDFGDTAEPVPEPATLALFGVGAVGLATRRWRQSRQR